MAKRKRRVQRSPIRRSSTTVAKTTRRRKRSGGGGLGANLKTGIKPILSSAMGGASYSLLGGVVQSPMLRTILGIAGAFALGMMNMPYVGAGMSGAVAYEFTSRTFGLGDDGDFEDAEYTRADLGEEEFLDDDGNVFALSDDGEPVMIAEAGTDYAMALSDEFDLSEDSGEQSVMMIPTYAN
jgi:hypothetical protein